MSRLFSSDVPQRDPRRRLGKLVARRTAHLYLVDFDTGKEWAYYPGDDLLDLGQKRDAIFDPVADQWWIRPFEGEPAFAYVYYEISTGYYVRIRDMMPTVDAITSPWSNEPTSVSLGAINTGVAGIVITGVAWSPDGQQVTFRWDTTPRGDEHITRYAVTENGSWGDLIEESDLGSLTGVDGASNVEQGQEIAWSPDGKYIGLIVADSGGDRGLFILGGADTGTLYLAASDNPNQYMRGAVSFSPDGRFIAVARAPAATSPLSANLVVRMYTWDGDSGSLAFVNDYAMGNAGSLTNKGLVFAWTPTADTLFVGLESQSTGGSLNPVMLGLIVANPVNSDGTLGTPIYEQRNDTRPVAGASPAGPLQSAHGISLNPDGKHLAIETGLSGSNPWYYVVPFENGAWGDRSNILKTVITQEDHQNLYWMDARYCQISPMGQLLWTPSGNPSLSLVAKNTTPSFLGTPAEASAVNLLGASGQNYMPRPPLGHDRFLPDPSP